MKKSLLICAFLMTSQSFALSVNLKVSGSILPESYKIENTENKLNVEKVNVLSNKIEKETINLENKESFKLKDWGSVKVEKMQNIQEERFFTIVSFGI